jgi:hypothetical protein
MPTLLSLLQNLSKTSQSTYHEEGRNAGINPISYFPAFLIISGLGSGSEVLQVALQILRFFCPSSFCQYSGMRDQASVRFRRADRNNEDGKKGNQYSRLRQGAERHQRTSGFASYAGSVGWLCFWDAARRGKAGFNPAFGRHRPFCASQPCHAAFLFRIFFARCLVSFPAKIASV